MDAKSAGLPRKVVPIGIGIALLCHAAVWASIESAHQTSALMVFLNNLRDAALGIALLYFTVRGNRLLVPTCVIIAVLVTFGVVSNAFVQAGLNWWSAPHIAIAAAAIATAFFFRDRAPAAKAQSNL